MVYGNIDHVVSYSDTYGGELPVGNYWYGGYTADAELQMNITSAQYTAPEDNPMRQIKATIDDNVMFVPINNENRHYVAIQEWVADGNTIEEAE